MPNQNPSARADLLIRRVGAYGFAVMAASAALYVRFLADTVLPPGFPFLTFFPAVIITAFLMGLGPGIVCALLSGLFAWHFFLIPLGNPLFSHGTVVALCFYLFVVTVDLVLIHLMQVKAQQFRASQRRTAALLDQQRVMFQELQHRVANNMMFVSSLLALQKRKLAAQPELGAAAFDEAQQRIEVMSRIHRRLYDPAALGRGVASHIQTICEDILTATGKSEVRCRIDADAVDLDVGRLLPLSLIVAEVVTNSCKHAFADRDEGEIAITLSAQPDGQIALTIADDGHGYDVDASAAGEGLGNRIVRSLAAQVGGTVTADGSKGSRTTVLFKP